MTRIETSKQVFGIIPARFASSRFPGKPLALLKGKPMVVWVAERASQVSLFDRVIVATDDERIYTTVTDAGFEAVMTSCDHPSGTDRIWEVVEPYEEAQIIINIQGDEPLVNPHHLEELIETLLRHNNNLDMVTLQTPLQSDADLTNPNVVKVVSRPDGVALYFSRSPIPYQRYDTDHPLYRHVGLYGYTRNALKTFVSNPPSALERCEGLEQLRALELGLKIGVVSADTHSKGIDTPTDLEELELELSH